MSDEIDTDDLAEMLAQKVGPYETAAEIRLARLVLRSSAAQISFNTILADLLTNMAENGRPDVSRLRRLIENLRTQIEYASRVAEQVDADEKALANKDG